MRRHPSLPRRLPSLWLISDARNDALLEALLAWLPRGSGFIYRHYHLPAEARRKRFDRLAMVAAQRRHLAILAGSPGQAREWGAAGAYGPPPRLQGGGQGLRLATVHSLRELGMARRARADAVLLSPVFPTRSHPGAKTLGPVRFRLLAARAGGDAIALGGMTPRRARRLRVSRWAAIDGLVSGSGPYRTRRTASTDS